MPFVCEDVCGDGEYNLRCNDCGYSEYASCNCSCEPCVALKWPVTECPKCGQKASPEFIGKIVPRREYKLTDFPLREVQSSMFRRLGWHAEYLKMVLKNGREMTYKHVPFEVYMDGLTWASLGQWYNIKIKGKFEQV
jgi:hypothetical protein